MTWVGTAALAVGTITSASAQKKAGKARNRINQFNAREIENQRINDEIETRESIRRQRIRNRKTLATQRVAGIKSGFKVDAGTPLELLAENASNLELQVQDAFRASEVRGQVARGKKQLSIFGGKSALSASNAAAFGTVARGVGQGASIFANR